MKNLSIIVLFVMLMTGCSKDNLDAVFLKRDTDKLSFAFDDSKATFTVRTKGKWTIDLKDAPWVTVDQSEGIGDGENVQVVTVFASRNIGEIRTGVIKLGAGQLESEIYLQQAEGKVVFGTPYFTGPLVPKVDLADVFLVIPYDRGALSTPVDVSVSVSGVGAPGIQVPSSLQATMTAMKGELRIPMLGMPSVLGVVNFEVNILGQNILVTSSVMEQSNPDPVGTVYLRQDFDLLTLGGDHVAGKAGIVLSGTWPKDENGKNILPANPSFVASASGNTDGTSDYFSTMAPSFVASRGLAGWTGLRVYERPGYVKIGTAASADGYLATPALSAIVGTIDVKVKFRVARWSESASADANASVTVKVLHAGTSSDADVEMYLTPSWVEKEIIVSNVTSQTIIEFRARNGGNGRFMIDDIEISKVIK